MGTFFILLLLLLFLFLLLAVLFYLIYTSFIEPGAVYYPTTTETVNDFLRLAGTTPQDTVMDLGSGDGRILVAFGKIGVKGIGYEIDPLLVLESRKKIAQENLTGLTTIYLKSFWLADFNKATIIVLYLFPHYMNRLQEILEKKLTHPLVLISNTYQFPNKKYYQNISNLYFYRFP